MQDPSYHELGPDKIPTAYPAGPDGPLKIKIISGQSHGVTSPVNPVGGCWYFHFIFKNKSTFFQDIRKHQIFLSDLFYFVFWVLIDSTNLAKGWSSFIYILKGFVSVGSETIQHEAFHTLVLSAQGNESGVSLTAAEDNTEFVLVGIYPSDHILR